MVGFTRANLTETHPGRPSDVSPVTISSLSPTKPTSNPSPSHPCTWLAVSLFAGFLLYAGGRRSVLWCRNCTAPSMSEHPTAGAVRLSIRVSERQWSCTGWDTEPEHGRRRRSSVFLPVGSQHALLSSSRGWPRGSSPGSCRGLPEMTKTTSLRLSSAGRDSGALPLRHTESWDSSSLRAMSGLSTNPMVGGTRACA